MCGIAGILSITLDPSKMRSSAELMQRALEHRGPDDAGIWQSPCGQSVLAHRRLSILDLSDAGRQPMRSADGRYTICFNGEIYNFRELRAELETEGYRFVTTSDTEVILNLYARDGADCVKRLRGMFALALWDESTRTAFLARDPFGIKPLYVHRTSSTLAFASELRALVKSDVFTATLNPEAVRRYFESGTVPEPLTLVHEVHCLEAGQTLIWHEGKATTQSYWHIDFEHAAPARGDEVARTRSALEDSVRHHFVSDVPVGVFLSGGIDSTALLALANATGNEGISAYCIAVDDEAADESNIAKRTAAHFGATYHEMRLDAKMAQGLFADFVQRIDQPTIDGLNTFTVSALAREHGMKVVLSGLGGDELFGGYSSFQKIPSMLRWRKLLRLVPGAVSWLEQGKSQRRRMADFVKSAGTVEDAFSSLRGIFSKADARELTRWITRAELPITEKGPEIGAARMEVSDQISRLELSRYMRNQLLRDSDVMSMARGLELRVPFVDKVLFEAVAGIPAARRLRRGKQLLLDAVPEVPEWVVNQKKRGFLFPFEKWLGADWGQAINAASLGSSVAMETWYQRWSVFVLRHAINQLCPSSFSD